MWRDAIVTVREGVERLPVARISPLGTAALAVVLGVGAGCARGDDRSASDGGVPADTRAPFPTPRQPMGIYAYFVFPALGADFSTVLEDPAVSGLAIEVGWATLNPNPPTVAQPDVDFCADTSPPGAAQPYDWRTLDAVFCAVETWNNAHPSATPKTVQLMAVPGFSTPAWALAELPPSCDSLFRDPPQSPGDSCGWATFLNSEGTATPTLQPLPLPWNATYKSSWLTFLQALAARYEPTPAFVSIAVAGPTATSYEIIEPNSNIPPTSTGPSGSTPPYSIPPQGLSQTTMWSVLLASPSSDPLHYSDPAYQSSDQVFVDEWDAAIDAYAAIFSGITLVVSTGNGLPDFPDPHPSFATPAAFAADCADDDMDCAAEATIESHFVDPSVGGTNAKATMTSGMEVSRATDEMGLAGAKLLAVSSTFSPRILGGAEFNTSFSRRPVTMGCSSPIPPDPVPVGCTLPAGCTTDDCNLPASCIPADCTMAGGIPSEYVPGYYLYDTNPSGQPSDAVPAQYLISPEQALYNTLRLFFGATPAAPSYGEPGGATPMNYLIIYADDLAYSMAAANSPVSIVGAGGTALSTTAQRELDAAAQQLSEIGIVATPSP